MRIRSVPIPQPPREIEMRFNLNDGWAVLAALSNWAKLHPDAQDVDKWKEWVKTLDKELRK